MRKTAPPSAKSTFSISLPDVGKLADEWLLVGDIDRHSKRTLANRRDILDKLLWFLRTKNFEECGKPELRAFFHYLNHGHQEPGGRWGNPRMTRPVTEWTVTTYNQALRAFFNWIRAERCLDEASPMECIPPPTKRDDEVQPYTEEQVAALLLAAKRTVHATRNEAILRVLYSTGCRASELCAIRRKDVNLQEYSIRIVAGKGGKERTVNYGRDSGTKAALYRLFAETNPADDDYIFLADRGTRPGEPLGRSGLRQIVAGLATRAKVTGVKSTVHAFRHYYALQYLKEGGDQFSLMQLLGHVDLEMTNRYVQLSRADVANRGRRFGPKDPLRSRGR